MTSRERRSNAPPISALLPVLVVCGASLGGCGESKQASTEAKQATAEASPTSEPAAAKPSPGSKLAAAAAAPANPSVNESAPQSHSKPANSKHPPAAPASAATSKASLTPDQLAITAQNLPQHPELWPVEVTVTQTLDFSGGNKVPAGRKVYLRKFEGAELNLYDRQLKNWFTAAVDETDVLERARERVKLPESERTSFFSRSVAAALETPSGADKDFAQADYFLVYQAKLGCGRCAMFIPELKTFTERMKPAHPFEVVFVSADPNAESMKQLQAKEKLPGRAVAYDKRLEAADLGTQAQGGETLPLVFLYDRAGQLVARNQPNGGKPSAEDVLATLEKKLGEKK